MVKIHDDPPVNQFRPSVDVLFQSVPEYVGSNSLGVILTGIGSDGAEGMLAMTQAGASTIAQDKDSCVVYGMPQQAVLRGAAQTVLPFNEIASEIISQVREMTVATS